MKKGKLYLIILVMICTGFSCLGTEYFVNKKGKDSNSGVNRKEAFLTIAKGVSMIKPGDIVTVGPGVYYESVSSSFAGSEGKKTIIRAERPGTVIMRGDIDAPGFKKVDGMRFTWVCDFKRKVEAVNERDMLKIYRPVTSLPQMDDNPGTWFYDSAQKKLYVHTSDSSSPVKHFLTVSVIRGFGMLFNTPRNKKRYTQNLEIDGFAYSGYNCNSMGGIPGGNAKWAVYIVRAENCIIKRCTAFLNGGGITMGRPKNSIIENCVAYANFSPFNKSGGNIIMWTPAWNSTIRNCIAYNSDYAGIRFYGGLSHNCLLENNISWNNKVGDLWIKTASNTSWAKNCVVTGACHVKMMKNSTCGFKGFGKRKDNSVIELNQERRLKLKDEFVDSDNMDYRLQSSSRFRKTGPNGSDRGAYPYKSNVFFVKPDGDDSASGTSVGSAWKSLARAVKNLKNGETLYILDGTYKGNLKVTASNVTIRRRGSSNVILKDGTNGLIITGENVEISGINIINCMESGIKAVNTKNLTITKCSIGACRTGINISNVGNLKLTHNTLANNKQFGVKLAQCIDANVSTNIFSGNLTALSLDEKTSDGMWSDFNSFAPGQKNCFSLNGISISLAEWQKKYSNNLHSYILKPQFKSASQGIFTLKNPWIFNGRGSLSMPIGPYNLLRQPASMEIIKKPYIHSVTSTTVNIEWYTTVDGATSEFAWGETEKCSNNIGNLYSGSSFHTVSLTGLKPGGKYYYKVISRNPVFQYHSNEMLAKADKTKKRSKVISKTFSFTTITKDISGKVYHVAINGNNRNDGLSVKNAWRTIRHAGSKVKAGDTVLVHKGRYNEVIWIRGTGDKNKPVTFRSALGEKVWLEGNEQRIKTAFLLSQKSYVTIDGFYLYDFESSNDAAIVVLGGSNNTVKRCFYDGRSSYYTPPIIDVRNSSEFILKNCFVTRGFVGSRFYLCPNLKIENNVFYFNQVTSIYIHNRADQKAYINHNIIFDNTIQKLGNWLVHTWHVEALREAYNCYYIRIPQQERNIVHFYRKNGKFEQQNVSYDKFLKITGQKKTSFFANPKVKGLSQIISFLNFKEWEQKWKANPWEMKKKHQQIEYKKNLKTGKFAALDFDDFFATNPKCTKAADGKVIGLVPKAFKKFKFNKQ